jgi:hypothetical protein
MRRNQNRGPLNRGPLKSPRFRIGFCDGELMSVCGGWWKQGLLISAPSGRGRPAFEQCTFALNFCAEGGCMLRNQIRCCAVDTITPVKVKIAGDKLHETSVYLTSASSFSLLSEARFGSSNRQNPVAQHREHITLCNSQDPICTTFRGLPEPKATLPSGRKRGFCGVKTPATPSFWEKQMEG